MLLWMQYIRTLGIIAQRQITGLVTNA